MQVKTDAATRNKDETFLNGIVPWLRNGYHIYEICFKVEF